MTETTTDTTTKRAKRPHSTNRLSPRYRDIVPATDGALACGVCGVWTPPGEQQGTETVATLGREPVNDAERLMAARRPIGGAFESRMTRCADCVARRERAAQLAAEYPGAARAGELAYYGVAAVNALELVLCAAEVAGRDLAIKRARDVHLACETLGAAAAPMLWRARFAGIAVATARPETAAATPWAHVTDPQRAEARRAFGGYLAARVERPVPIWPEDAAACYLCGVESVTMMPSHAGAAWRRVRVSPEHLGGPRNAPRVDAEVCATCAAGHDEIGSYGPTLLDALMLRAAGVAQHAGAQGVQLTARAWGTSGRRKPNATPWAHLNLGQLAEDVRAGRFA